MAQVCFPTEIGLTGGGQDNNLLYISGIPHKKVASAEIIDKVVQLVENKVNTKTLTMIPIDKVQDLIARHDN